MESSRNESKEHINLCIVCTVYTVHAYIFIAMDTIEDGEKIDGIF